MDAHRNEGHTELLTQQQTEIIQELVNCALACEACSTACLNEKDLNHLSKCVQLTRDCAEVCFQAARLIMRKSELSDQLLTVCEEACRLCADECSKHQHDHCELCAEACISCADNCSTYYRR